MREEFLVFGQPVVRDEDVDEVVACLRSAWIGTGPRVSAFEESFRKYRDANYAVAVNSCTAALHLSLLAAGLRPGDEVITTPMTFCATINAIIHAGLTPILADIDPATMNIDAESVEDHIGPRTRGLLPVHFAGRPCDMAPLVELARRHDLKVIEDCAHAIEATYDGQSVGTFGDFGCFSFYVTKNMTTGEGGMVLTRTDDAQAKIKTLALHGLSRDAWHRYGDAGYKHYEVVDCGFKYNMTDLQAALGIHQLERLERNWHRRAKIWRFYLDSFSDLPIGLPATPAPNVRHAYHLFTLMIDKKKSGLDRDEFVGEMGKRNIGVGVHYLSIPEHPFYQRRFGWQPAHYPNAARIGRQTVSIPLSAGLTDDDVGDVVRAVRQIVGAA